MIFVIEFLRDGTANIFRSAANFITHDGSEQVGHQVFWSTAEAVQAHQRGAEIFAHWGPAGYKAFPAFEKFLQDSGTIPKPPSHGRVKKPGIKKKRTPF